jgi:hypothetical protein
MNRTHHFARVIAPVALLGGVVTATPLAHAAPAHPAKVAHLHAVGGAFALAGTSASTVSPDGTILICINHHCVIIRF